jgi:hypothetical protein
VSRPELQTPLPVLYPGLFDDLAALDESGTPRADLRAVRDLT